MNITVTKNQVSINTDYVLNDKEYNINQCYFTFSDEYTDDLVKKAIFVQGTSTIEMSIINNQCQIPAEVLNNGQFELRVYAYEVDGDELLLRYSPSYTTAYVRTGSYIENAESPEVITPTQFEQYMQAMNDGLNEVANVDIDAEQLDDGMSVTITNRYGEDKTVYAYDGEKGETGATPNIQIGTVVTGDHSEVTRTGTNENPIFNFVLEKGDKGDTGNGIASVTKTSTSGLTDTYTITYTNGTTTTFDVTNGKSITNIAKTSTSGLEDTYTITYNDNTTSTFTVTNGNGVSSIEKTGTQDNVDTYTIYYTNGTTSTFTVTNSTVTNQEFEELKAEHEELVNTLPRVEGTGTSITLDNTAQYKMNVALSGNTSQVQYTGKNLLNTQNWAGGYIDSSGNLHTGNTNALFDGYIEVNSNTQYVISTNTSIRSVAISEFDSSQVFIQRKQSGNNVSLLTITTTANTKYVRVQFNYDNSTTITQTIIDGLELQLESGSSRTSYEPYVGGIPSPNPLYPQPIKKVTGNNSITVCGKNLYNVNDTINVASEYTVDSDGWISISYNNTGSSIKYLNYFTHNLNVKPSTNYNIMIEVKSVSGNGTLSYTSSQTSSNQGQFTSGQVAFSELSSNTVYQYIKITKSQWSGDAGLRTYVSFNSGVQGSITFRISVLEDTTITPQNFVYEPYQSQTYPINLGSLEYCKIGNYSDEFALSTGKNLLPIKDGTSSLNGITITVNNGEITINGTSTATTYFKLSNGVVSNDSFNNDWSNETCISNRNGTTLSLNYVSGTGNTTGCAFRLYENSSSHITQFYPTQTNQTETYNTEGKISCVTFFTQSGKTFTNYKFTMQLEYGSATIWEPYGIGNWYLKKNIGKVVLDGTENWIYQAVQTRLRWQWPLGTRSNLGYCYSYVVDTNLTNDFTISIQNSNIFIKDSRYTSSASFKEWLTTNNVYFYYVLATTTGEAITDTTLIEQLNNLYNQIKSYKGQTNITQTNAELPFNIGASALYDLNNLISRVATLETEV